MRAFIVIFFITALCSAQDMERVLMDGQINVPPGDDASGITIFNTNTNQGTVSRDDGTFSIMVGLADELQFSALQYESFIIEVTQALIEAGELNLFVSTNVTELPEVVVGAPDLSGNIEVDVRRIPVEMPELPAESAAQINDFEWEFPPDQRTSLRNAAMGDRGLHNGLNFVNLFKSVYDSFSPEQGDTERVEDEIRALYDDSFFQENLDIPRRDIHDFLLFSQEQGLNQELLQDGSELDLIEFLIRTSRAYKQRDQG